MGAQLLRRSQERDLAEECVKTFLCNVCGEPDSEREGLSETPYRVATAWANYWGAGYREDPKEVLKTFEDGANNYDQMLTVKDIPIYSHCEHHLAPFFGKACIGYIPNGKIVGISKLVRVVEAFSRRLQTQETLSAQIGRTLHNELKPRGVAVVIDAAHQCMTTRGVRQPGVSTITSYFTGVFEDDPQWQDKLWRQLSLT